MIPNVDQYMYFLSCKMMQHFEMHIFANNLPVCFYVYGRYGWFKQKHILLYNRIQGIRSLLKTMKTTQLSFDYPFS